MSFEPKRKKEIVMDGKSDDYSWLNGRPDKDAILKHAHRTGAEIPKGLHVNSFGGVNVDENGIRHNWVLKAGDSQENYAMRHRYMQNGFEVKEDSDGVGYHLSIPQTEYEAMEKKQIERYELMKNPSKVRVKGGDPSKDWVEEKSFERENIDPEELLKD